MLSTERIQIPEEIKDSVYKKFRILPLKNKLIIYSKLFHGNSFKPQNNDLFNLNRRTINKIFRQFIDLIKEEYAQATNKKSNKLNSKKNT